jgi:CMP-N-acetylneuraminic acid synthetase/spore coat polysaccharide biosynthesis predicted glycosyltransferase SpsG
VNERPLLAVVPVRGGSKRIPRKWAQLVAGRPLLQHTIDTARQASSITRLVVSTEDPAIAAYARLRGVEVHDRPEWLADDDTPLADVVANVAGDLDWDGDVAVLQATCPLLRPETVDRVVADWRRTGADWAITTTPISHILWDDNGPLTPRVNSQQLAAYGLQQETGAVQLFTARAARGVIATRIMLPIGAHEALDIDTHADLAAARQALSRRTILFHVVASDDLGSGHLRRCLQLSDALAHHNVAWSPWRLAAWAHAEAERHGVRWSHGPDDDPHLVVIDALDAAGHLASRYAADGIPTVVIEPDGAARARRFADLVIDEFADPSLSILRPEFLCLPPYEVRDDRYLRVLVTFGGTDPTGMNGRVERLLKHGTDAFIDVVFPRIPGRSMAEAMRQADLVVTSQGRTVHEAAAVGVPCLSIAVNERESRHAQLPGVVYLGLAHTLSDAAILDAVNRLLGSPALRREMSVTALRVIDGRGLGRVVRMIEGLLCD